MRRGMRAACSRKEPARDGSLARERAPLGRRPDRGYIEHDRTKDPAHLRAAQDVACGPGTAAPSERHVDAPQKIAYEGAPCTARPTQEYTAQKTRRLRAERERSDVDEIERERWKRQRREVAADRDARARARRERLDGHCRSDARKGEDAAGAIDELVVHVDERSNWSPREGDHPERREGDIHIPALQALAAQHRH